MADSVETVEVETAHGCVLALLARRLAAAEGDRATLAADALAALLRGSTFDRCCAPRYLALAPDRGPREVQIPVERCGDIEVRVIVWPAGSRDGTHPHVDGWTAFVPVRGDLLTVEQGPSDGTARPLPPRRPVLLRPEERVRHRISNAGREAALTIHVSGS